RTEEVARTPRGWRVRTRVMGKHVVRIAFPLGPRRKGAGQVVQILHPKGENPSCNRRKLNPLLESILGGLAAGAAVVGAQEGIKAYRGRKKKGKEAPKQGNKRRRAGKRNQGNGAEAAYQEFHGRAPREVVEMQEELLRSGDYFALGNMAGMWLQPVKGRDPSGWGPAEIEFEKGDKVILAGTPGSTQLYLVGGKQKLPVDYLRSKGLDTSKRFVPLGCVYGISYVTEKQFDSFKTVEYGHEFGEETGERPQVFYDQETQRIFLVGGAYHIAPPESGTSGMSPGIVN
ncbi:MAG: hypothetical protein V3U28_06685, partial [Candidatus Acidoferrales bacterium]